MTSAQPEPRSSPGGRSTRSPERARAAHERDPISRLRVLSALTSNVSLNAARSIATADDRNIDKLITLQMILGAVGFLASMLLGWALIGATRRQTAHFRSLVNSSTDLVLVFGAGGCRYASDSVVQMVGRTDAELLGAAFAELVHPDDLALVHWAYTHGEPAEIVFRLMNRFGEWRHLEAHVTDLRGNRQIRGVVFNARDISERVRLEEQLTQQAFHDGLTGMANRALFRDRLEQALARSERSLNVLAVLLVDLDGFKQVNDSLGHDAGDKLLQAVAERFAAEIRPSDTLARLGGDEFAVLIDGAHESHAISVAGRLLARLRADLAGRSRAQRQREHRNRSASGRNRRERELLRHADVAMYAAKEAGRDASSSSTTTWPASSASCSGSSTSCGWGFSAASSRSTTSPRSTSRTARSWASRRSSAGTRPGEASCSRTGSSASPSRPA